MRGRRAGPLADDVSGTFADRGGREDSGASSGARGLVQRQLGGLPREFWVLWSGTLVNRLGAFVAPFLVLYLTRERGLSPATAGVVLALYGAGALVSQVAGGVLADRIGRRPTLVLSMVLFSGAVSFLGLVQALPLLVLAAIVTGLTTDLYRPASSALVADVIPSRDRARAFGLLFWAINLGFAVATLLAGLLATRSWGLLFAADAITSLLFAGVIARGITETRPPAQPGRGGREAGMRDVVRDRLLLAFVGITMVFACVYFQMFSTLPIAMGDDGLGPAAYGISIAVNGVVIVVLQPLASGWLGRRARVPALALSLLVVGIGFGLNAFATTTPQYMAVVVVWTLGEIGHAALASSIIADLAPPHLRGRYMGVYGLAYGGAAVIGPLAGTRTLQSLGAPTLWFGCAALGALMAGAVLALRGALDRRAALAAATPA